MGYEDEARPTGKPSPLMGEGLGGGEYRRLIGQRNGADRPPPVAAGLPASGLASGRITPTPTRPHRGGGGALTIGEYRSL